MAHTEPDESTVIARLGPVVLCEEGLRLGGRLHPVADVEIRVADDRNALVLSFATSGGDTLELRVNGTAPERITTRDALGFLAALDEHRAPPPTMPRRRGSRPGR